jgi:hypothetical protein
MIWQQYWVLGVSALSLFGSALGFFSDRTLKEKQYVRAPAQVTPLCRRVYGAWTLLASCIRLQYALNPNNGPLYQLCMGTFALALALFAYELVVARTMSVKTVLAPFVVASSTSAMLLLYPPALVY